MATMTVQARLSPRDLAIYAEAMFSSGNIITTKSDLVWRMCREVAKLLERDGYGQTIQTDADGLRYLESIGLGFGKRSREGKELLNIKQTWDREMEAREDVGEKQFTITKEMFEGAQEMAASMGHKTITWEEYLETQKQQDGGSK